MSDTIIRGAAHYNALQADAWKMLAQETTDALATVTDALGAALPVSSTHNEKHAAAIVHAHAVLAKARGRGL